MDISSNRYSKSDIRKTTWGPIAKLDDGRERTIWRLTFRVPQDPANNVDIYHDDKAGLDAVLTISESGTGDLTITTKGHAMAAEYYPLTFKCFRIVDDTVAEIATIEGHPKEWYAPFR